MWPVLHVSYKLKQNCVYVHPIFLKKLCVSLCSSSVKTEVFADAFEVAGGGRLASAQPQDRRGSTYFPVWSFRKIPPNKIIAD